MNQDLSTTAAHGAPRAWRSFLLYLLRSAVVLALVAALVKQRMSGFFAAGQITNELFDLVSQLDLYRALFYALLPVLAALLLAPASARRAQGRNLAMLLLAIAAGLLAAWMLSSVVELWRPRQIGRPGLNQAALYVGFNVALALYFHVGNRMSPQFQRLIARAVLLADVLAPLLVWSAYRQRAGRGLILLRPLPALLVCCAPLLPWLLAPQPFDPQSEFHPALQRIDPREYYQVIIDRADNGLILSTNHEGLFKIDRRTGAPLADNHDLERNMQGVGYDPQAGLVVLADPAIGRTLFVDAADLHSVRRAAVSNPLDTPGAPPGGDLWRTSLRPDGALYCYSMDRIVRLDPQGERIEAIYSARIAYFAPDPGRNELHLALFEPGALVALDADSLVEKRRIEIPPFAERVGFDPQTDRLFVALPLQGQVLVVDAASYRVVKRVDSIPGVRALYVDPPSRLLLLGGFAPYLELRSLDDLSLIDRILAPPWMRWFDVDHAAGLIYFTSTHCGVFSLDLKLVGPNSPGHNRRTADPFFKLAALGTRLAPKLLGWE